LYTAERPRDKHLGAPSTSATASVRPARRAFGASRPCGRTPRSLPGRVAGLCPRSALWGWRFRARTSPGAATMRRQIKDLGQAPAAARIYATCVEDSLPAPPYDPLI